MKDVWLPFPVRWREIKNEVAGMHGNFLTYREYADLCDLSVSVHDARYPILLSSISR